jgi:quercetin dioxygenase-like cupin family protein
MAIPHAKSGEVVDVRPLGSGLADAQTTTLVKTPTLEVIRLVLPAGKEICHQHSVPGEVLVQCLEGTLTVEVDGSPRPLETGQMLYLVGGVTHAIRATDGASALLTILLR